MSYSDLRIYLLMVTPFLHGDDTAGYGVVYGPSANGNIKGMIDAIDYIHSTGANTIWHTPVFDSDAGEPDSNGTVDLKLDATGYYVRNYFAIDPLFGTLDQYIQFVNMTHQRGMYVIMDIAIGHNKGDVVASPSGIVISNPPNFEDPVTTAFFQEVFTYWINTAQVDGFRLDQAYQPPPEVWLQLQATIQQVCYTRLQQGYKWGVTGFMIAEILCPQTLTYQDGLNSCGGNAPPSIEQLEYNIETVLSYTNLPSAFNFPMMYRLWRVIAGIDITNEPVGTLDSKYLADGYRWMQKVGRELCMVLSNHDFPRFGNLLLRSGLVKSIDDPGYWERYQLAFSYLAQYSGPIQWFYNDELASNTYGFKDRITDTSSCLRLNLCDDESGRIQGKIEYKRMSQCELELYRYVRNLMRIRQHHPALNRGDTHILSCDEVFSVIKTYKEDNILFIMNVSTKKQERIYELPRGTFAVNLLNGDRLQPKGGKVLIIIPALTSIFFQLIEDQYR